MSVLYECVFLLPSSRFTMKHIRDLSLILNEKKKYFFHTFLKHLRICLLLKKLVERNEFNDSVFFFVKKWTFLGKFFGLFALVQQMRGRFDVDFFSWQNYLDYRFYNLECNFEEWGVLKCSEIQGMNIFVELFPKNCIEIKNAGSNLKQIHMVVCKSEWCLGMLRRRIEEKKGKSNSFRLYQHPWSLLIMELSETVNALKIQV